jgi:tetratricopeptide (TPR) repeat protein
MDQKFRNGLVLIVILAAITIPFISSGYSEIKAAENSPSHLDAATHYQAAALRLPWRADLYELAGHHYYYAEEYSEADASYQKAFNGKALSPDGWVAWGDVLYLNGNEQKALVIWEDAAQRKIPSSVLYSRLAVTYEGSGDYPDAVKALQQYTTAQPEDAAAYYRLGLLLTLSDPNEALTKLISASQLDPQFDPAVQTLRTALNLSSVSQMPAEQKVIIGRGLGLVNEWELAHVIFEDAAAIDGNNAEAWAWLGEADQQAGGNEALTHLDRALSLDSNSSIVRGLRGLYFQRVGNHREALIEFQTAANLEPENPVWYISIGEEFSKLGDLIRALEAYQYTTVLEPDNAEYWRLLAGFCAQNTVNVRDVGIPAAQTAVILTPDDPLALDVLGWLLVLDGRHFEAETILMDALSIDPQLALAHFHLALTYLQTDDRASAYGHLVKARDLGSTEADILLKVEFPQ